MSFIRPKSFITCYADRRALRYTAVPANIKSAYLNQAPYWLTFFPLRGYIVVFDLAQIINLVVIWLKTMYVFCSDNAGATWALS